MRSARGVSAIEEKRKVLKPLPTDYYNFGSAKELYYILVLYDPAC